MKATARIAVERRAGSDEVVDRSCSAPISVRRCGDRVLLAASAAAPVGGDELELVIDVGPGACADVGSVAAGLVWPGPAGTWSRQTTRCTIGNGAHLRLALEPLVSVVGSMHRSVTSVHLEVQASCVVIDDTVLGRRGEPSGRLDQRLRVERAGAVLVDHGESFGPDVPGALSSVSVGAARHVLSAVVAGCPPGDAWVRVEADRAAAWMPVADDAALLLAVGPDRPAVLGLVAHLAPLLRATSPGVLRTS